MKRTGFITVVLLLLCLSGCVCLTGCAGITPEAVKGIATQVKTLNTATDRLQDLAMPAVSALAVSDAITPEYYDAILKANSEVDRAQIHVEATTNAVLETEFSGGGGLVTGLETARAINRGTAGFNPYAPVIEIGLALALGVVGIFARKKSIEASDNAFEADRNANAFAETVRGIERSSGPDLKENLSSAQSPATKVMVKQIKELVI